MSGHFDRKKKMPGKLHQRFFGLFRCSYRSHFGCLCGKAGFRWSRHGATRCAGVKLITGTTYEHPWTHDLQLVATLMASWSSWIWPFKFATKSLISCEENMCKERGKRKSTSHESHKIHLDLHNATLLYTRHMCLIKVMPPPRSIGECTCKESSWSHPFATRENMRKNFGMWWKQVAWHMNSDDTLISHATRFLAASSCFK